jgi:hypothetical protein
MHGPREEPVGQATPICFSLLTRSDWSLLTRRTGFLNRCVAKLAHETLSPVVAVFNDKTAIKASSKIPVFPLEASSENPGDLILTLPPRLNPGPVSRGQDDLMNVISLLSSHKELLIARLPHSAKAFSSSQWRRTPSFNTYRTKKIRLWSVGDWSVGIDE